MILVGGVFLVFFFLPTIFHSFSLGVGLGGVGAAAGTGSGLALPVLLVWRGGAACPPFFPFFTFSLFGGWKIGIGTLEKRPTVSWGLCSCGCCWRRLTRVLTTAIWLLSSPVALVMVALRVVFTAVEVLSMSAARRV